MVKPETQTAGHPKHPNLASALSAFQGAMPVVAKSNTASIDTKTGRGYSYRYADLADMMRAAAPILAEHGLAISYRTYLDENSGGLALEGALLHGASNEERTSVLPLIASGDPKALGSAITYARRYLLGCLTGIVTDEDDDGEAASQAHQHEPRPRREQRQSREQGQERPGGEDRDWSALLAEAGQISDYGALVEFGKKAGVPNRVPAQVRNAFVKLAERLQQVPAPESAPDGVDPATGEITEDYEPTEAEMAGMQAEAADAMGPAADPDAEPPF